METYKFDYIKEMVKEWDKSVPRDLNAILGTPFGIRLPIFSINENGKLKYTPPYDYYGQAIYDITKWMQQREAYCKKLAKEYKNRKK